MSTASMATRSVVGGEVVATYPSYAQAQHAIDRLSDSGFPVGRTAIVGRDLKMVEKVTGRVTLASAILMGAGSGAWFGLLLGLAVTLFDTGTEWIGFVVVTAALGAIWGGIFGLVAHAVTRRRGDFASTKAIVASGYDVTTDASSFERASRLLS